MTTPSAPTAIRSLLFGGAAADISQVAYSAEKTIEVFGVAPATVWRLIRRGELPTRNTGKQYLVSGATIIDVLGRRPDGINDPRTVITPDTEYSLHQLATFLGVPYQIAHRLTHRRDAPLTPERRGTRLFLPGSVILDYLAGSDEPIRYQPAHRASA
jgi:hypothetical protein